MRCAVTGDHVRYTDDGTLELLGRGSQCINSGGEKIYVEEVESVLRSHPGVADAVVVGTPHERLGQQVVAIIEPASNPAPTLDELNAHGSRHLAKFKLPKALVVVERMVRSPSGKADYAWARQTAMRALEGSAVRG